MSVAATGPAGASKIALRPLVGGCTIGLSISWNIANIGPVATLLAQRYGTTLAVIGLLTTTLFFAELAVMLPGGRAIDRYGPKRVGVVAVVLSLLPNLALMVFPSVGAAIVLRGFAGLGVGLGFLAGAIYAQSGATGRAAALAGGIYGGMALGGGGLALAVVPQLVGALQWRAPYASGAAVAALALPILALCPSTPGHGGSRTGPGLRALMTDPRLVRLGAISSVSFAFSVILGNWVVTLLQRTGGLSRGSAGAIGSLILILGIVGRSSGGILAGAAPRSIRRMLAAGLLACACGTAVVALSLGPVPDIAATMLIGVTCGLPFGVTVAGATSAHPQAAGAAVGAMNTYPVLVIVCGAPLVGLSFNLPGNGRIGFGIMAAVLVAALSLLPGLDL
ncbi:MAG: MFS transporter [Solirubrobacteraceae bacterium]